ncbi:hypothetical protein C6P42_001206 [Pichia californica]|nr:hypothetical protein C6P42_001206 [[Candida] californica]
MLRFTNSNANRIQFNIIIKRYQTTTSGILGTNRFIQNDSKDLINNNTTSITITDPYIIYKQLILNKKIDSDPFQLALIKKLSKLSKSLQLYKPDLTKIKINKLVRELEIKYNKQKIDKIKFLKWFHERENNKLRKNLIKILNDYDELNSSYFNDIPKGLLINGEVGCGKTMLMDIFADSLPIQNKWRVHWNVFIQWCLKEIEKISINKRNNFIQLNHSLLNYENEFILFEVASKLILKCNVLIIDEFMLPDIASAKIINVMFIYYFKLGGVLIASSNRLPEELYSGSINKLTMGNFEKILRLRCDVWDMQSNNDYRINLKENDIAKDKWLILKTEQDYEKNWNKLIKNFIDLNNCENNLITFKSYGRDIIIPKAIKGLVAYFDFNDIIKDSSYGPSDFISIATKYPTIIIDNVPILSIKMKNYARLLISFIDAIYDSKCNLIIKLETDPNNLFFPDINKDNSPAKFKCTPIEDGPNYICLNEAKKSLSNNNSNNSNNNSETDTIDIQNIEMYAKTEIDMLNPYRPNFATYEDNNKDYNISKGEENEMNKNFTDMKKFTGEDEMFAYKRAISRIYEMTHSKRWRMNKWVPLHQSIKPWENDIGDVEKEEKIDNNNNNSNFDDIKLDTFKQNKDAPEFKEYNFWSMGRWNNKKDKLKDDIAKKWVEGADNFKESPKS